MIAPYTIKNGSPEKPGAHYDGKGTNFSLFSANAQKVELCLFDPSGQHETARIALPARTGNIWHGYIEGLKSGQLYGYRVHGPYEPENGHRFNPNKLLLDPYARAFGGAFKWDDSHYGYTPGSPDGDLSFDMRDNAPYMIKAQVPQPTITANNESTVKDWRNTIIYEMHVRGMTMDNSSVPETVRGTFKGAADDSIISHIKQIGVTTIELMPVQAFFNDHWHEKRGSCNYWGYNTLGFFAPEPQYGDATEFKAMVEKFHESGIEVLLDVVYNHTFEGSHTGPTLSWRGIDNASYYRLQTGNPRYYENDSGCGNTLDAEQPQVQRMILDSLHFWTEEMGVDGFRFDLATILGRRASGFDEKHPLLEKISKDPILSKKKLIAEPWDIGSNGYHLGAFPHGWHEWNDVFRDSVRGFWHGHQDHIGKIAYAVTGSRHHFNRKNTGNTHSINFITAHDGFTLNDLVSYNIKHNESNGEENRDGNNNNISFNHGTEGWTNNPVISALRKKQMRNFIATLMLSHGTPLLLAGDEFGNTQEGNNNVYCQDNSIGWINFSNKNTAEGRSLMEFTGKLTALRRQYSVLNPVRPLDGKEKSSDGIKDITWYHCSGSEMSHNHWCNHQEKALGVLFNGMTKNSADPADNRLFIIFNAHSVNIPFVLPELPCIQGWERILDTSAPDIERGKDKAVYMSQKPYYTESQSLVIFHPVS